jgi:hypothetical protein
MINFKFKKNYFFLNILYISCSFDTQREKMHSGSPDLSLSQENSQSSTSQLSYTTSNSEKYISYQDFEKNLTENIDEIFKKLLSFIKNLKKTRYYFFFEKLKDFKEKENIGNFSKTEVINFTGQSFENLPLFLNKNCSNCGNKLYNLQFSFIYLKTIEKNSEFCCTCCYNEEQKKASQSLDKTFYYEIPLVLFLENFLIRYQNFFKKNELKDFCLILDTLEYLKKHIPYYCSNLEKEINNYCEKLASLEEENKKKISFSISIGFIKTDKAIIEEKNKNLEIINKCFEEIKKINFGESFKEKSEIKDSRISEKNSMAESRVSIFSQSLVSQVCSRYKNEEKLEESEYKKSTASEEEKNNFQNELEKLQNLFIHRFLLNSSEYGSISDDRSYQFISKGLIDKLNELTLGQNLEFLKKKINLNGLIFSLEKINDEKIFKLLTPAEVYLIKNLFSNEKINEKINEEINEEILEIILSRKFGIDHLKTVLERYFYHKNKESRAEYLKEVNNGECSKALKKSNASRTK